MGTKNITISKETFPIVEYRGNPVVTLAMIDRMHGRKSGTASSNFKANKARFEEGKHYHLIDFSKKEEFLPFGMNIPPRGLIVLTERGYLLLAKSLTDDLSWDVQEKLIDGYFRAKEGSNQGANDKMALPDKTEKHIWLTVRSNGDIIRQVELDTPETVATLVHQFFGSLLVLSRENTSKIARILIDRVMGSANDLLHVMCALEIRGMEPCDYRDKRVAESEDIVAKVCGGLAFGGAV